MRVIFVALLSSLLTLIITVIARLEDPYKWAVGCLMAAFMLGIYVLARVAGSILEDAQIARDARETAKRRGRRLEAGLWRAWDLAHGERKEGNDGDDARSQS